MYIVLGSF